MGLSLFSSPFRRALALLVLAWIIISWWWYRHTIGTAPTGHHAWAMGDYYAMALRFVEEGFNIFRAQTFNLQTRDGVTASDLPLPAWLTALSMSILHTTSPWVFRGLTGCVSLLGLIFFFRTLYEGGVAPLRAAVITVLMGSLSGWVYYHQSMLPSPWALSTFLGGLWALQRFVMADEASGQRLRYAIYMTVGVTLAALIRKPFILYMAVLTFWMWRRHWANRKIWLVWGSGILVFALWQVHERYLMAYYGSIFLRSTMSAESLSQTWQLTMEALKKWGLVWFSPLQLVWLLAVTIIGVVFREKKLSEPPRQLDKWLFFSFVGVGVAYFLLMLRQFIDHDYYALDSFYPALLLGAALGAMATQRIKWIFGLECLLLIAALFWAKKSVNWYGELVQSKAGETTNQAYQHSRDLLQNLQVPLDARMMVFEAYSFNLPLVGMRRTGYCLMTSRPEEQEKYLAMQPEYAVCLDTFFVSEVVNDNPAIFHELAYVGGDASLLVFQPRPLPDQSLEQLLSDQWQLLTDTTVASDNEYLLSHSFPMQSGHKILLHGRISLDQPGELVATAAFFQQNKKMAIVEKPVRLRQRNTFIFRSTDLLIPAVEADEMRIYLWNPERRKVAFQEFRISVVLLRFQH